MFGMLSPSYPVAKDNRQSATCTAAPMPPSALQYSSGQGDASAPSTMLSKTISSYSGPKASSGCRPTSIPIGTYQLLDTSPSGFDATLADCYLPSPPMYSLPTVLEANAWIHAQEGTSWADHDLQVADLERHSLHIQQQQGHDASIGLGLVDWLPPAPSYSAIDAMTAAAFSPNLSGAPDLVTPVLSAYSPTMIETPTMEHSALSGSMFTPGQEIPMAPIAQSEIPQFGGCNGGMSLGHGLDAGLDQQYWTQAAALDEQMQLRPASNNALGTITDASLHFMSQQLINNLAHSHLSSWPSQSFYSSAQPGFAPDGVAVQSSSVPDHTQHSFYLPAIMASNSITHLKHPKTHLRQTPGQARPTAMLATIDANDSKDTATRWEPVSVGKIKPSLARRSSADIGPGQGVHATTTVATPPITADSWREHKPRVHSLPSNMLDRASLEPHSKHLAQSQPPAGALAREGERGAGARLEQKCQQGTAPRLLPASLLASDGRDQNSALPGLQRPQGKRHSLPSILPELKPAPEALSEAPMVALKLLPTPASAPPTSPLKKRKASDICKKEQYGTPQTSLELPWPSPSAPGKKRTRPNRSGAAHNAAVHVNINMQDKSLQPTKAPASSQPLQQQPAPEPSATASKPRMLFVTMEPSGTSKPRYAFCPPRSQDDAHTPAAPLPPPPAKDAPPVVKGWSTVVQPAAPQPSHKDRSMTVLAFDHSASDVFLRVSGTAVPSSSSSSSPPMTPKRKASDITASLLSPTPALDWGPSGCGVSSSPSNPTSAPKTAVLNPSQCTHPELGEGQAQSSAWKSMADDILKSNAGEVTSQEQEKELQPKENQLQTTSSATDTGTL